MGELKLAHRAIISDYGAMSTPLISRDGRPFDHVALKAHGRALEALSDEQRLEYRNDNSEAIAALASPSILVVSGPGTGKSTLFLRRIEHWLTADPGAHVLVTSFVRKLVRDLRRDLNQDERLKDEQKGQVRVFTLHKLARSIVEQSHGTVQWPFKPFFKIIAEPWDEVLWEDVLAFHPEKPRDELSSLRGFNRFLHLDGEVGRTTWVELEETYFRLCQFYNAAGFADLIIRARIAAEERSELVPELYFIIDEYQDFNRAEEAFIGRLCQSASGVLVAGDDDQVLYEFKAGDPALIRALYEDTKRVNAMLPFCSRCSFHITKASAAFIREHPEGGRIEKLYLPLAQTNQGQRVEVVACAAPATAVDYIGTWLEEHRGAILQRQQDLRNSKTKAKDAYLLVLSPSRQMKFLGKSGQELRSLIETYRTLGTTTRSKDYDRIVALYAVGRYPEDNFSFRKAIDYQGISVDRVHELIVAALSAGCEFSELEEDETRDILNKARQVREIMKEAGTPEHLASRLGEVVALDDEAVLAKDLTASPLSDSAVDALQQEQEDAAEQREGGAETAHPVELMTIVGAKGLSADHVIIIGCDDVSLNRTSPKAFYVGLTRARNTLQLLVNMKAVGAKRAHNFLSQLPDENTAYVKYTKAGGKVAFASKPEFRSYFERLSYQQAKKRPRQK